MTMSEDGGLAQWLGRARTHYRERASHERAAIMEHVRKHVNFDEPSQIFGFAVADPPWQGFAVTRMPALPDEFTVHEDIPRWEMQNVMTETFRHPVWDQPFSAAPKGYSHYMTMREVGFRALDTLQSNQRVSNFIDVERGGGKSFIQHGPIAPDCDEYSHLGSLQHVVPEEWVDLQFKEGRESYEREQKRLARPPPDLSNLVTSRENPYGGHGAFHARDIRIGVVTSKNLPDWYWNERDFPGVITYRGKLGPHPFIATQNGFLCVETQDKADAHRWINYVMAGFLSEGLPAVVVRAQDMASAHLPVGNEYVWGGTFPGSDRRRGSFLDQRRISEAELEAVLRKAEHHAKQSYAKLLPSLLEAHTHLEGNEPTQSFVFSWSIIERIFSEKWTGYLESGNVSSNRREKLEGATWTLDMRSETLELGGAITKDLYDKLTPVRRTRNRLFHGRQEIATYEEGVQALDLANELLSESGPPIRAPRKVSEHALWVGEFL